VHVVIGTPGRVLAMLDAGYMDPSALRTLVLDEADTLLNMGFEEEVQIRSYNCPLPTAHCPLPTAHCSLTSPSPGPPHHQAPAQLLVGG
jgi:superfamily II DNA/RNA helicase